MRWQLPISFGEKGSQCYSVVSKSGTQAGRKTGQEDLAVASPWSRTALANSAFCAHVLCVRNWNENVDLVPDPARRLIDAEWDYD